jgi:methionine-rich copper-binding protein CopC
MRKLLLVLAATLVALLPATPASAHAELLSTDPAKDAVLVKAPTSVTLVFTERLNPDFTTIVVSHAARQRIPASAPAVDAATVTARLDRSPANGSHTVAYRVVSVDGHTLQGSYTFTVTDPALPAAAEAAAPPTGSGSIPAGVLIGLGTAGAVLAVFAAYLYLIARRRAVVLRSPRVR